MNKKTITPPKNTAYLSNKRKIELSEGDAPFWTEIIRVGDWSESYKQFLVTKMHLDDFVKNFKKNVLRQSINELQLNYGHERCEEAAGWITELEIREDSLWGLVNWTPKARESIRDGEWRYISAEISWVWEDDETKKQYNNVLTGAALTNIPFVSGMKAVEASGADKPTKFSNSITPFPMEVLKTLLASLAGKKSVTASEFSLLKTACACLSDDEKAEIETQVAEVEAKIEESTPPAPTTPVVPAPTDASKDFATALELSQARAELAETKKRMEAMELDARKKSEVARVTELSKVGKVLPKDIEKNVSLLMSLSLAQSDAVFASWEALPGINLSEMGSSKGDGVDSDSAYAAFKTEFLSKNPSASITTLQEAFYKAQPDMAKTL
ncbi:MAG: phage protease [Candidatus Peregrinibacteria bacterium]